MAGDRHQASIHPLGDTVTPGNSKKKHTVFASRTTKAEYTPPSERGATRPPWPHQFSRDIDIHSPELPLVDNANPIMRAHCGFNFGCSLKRDTMS